MRKIRAHEKLLALAALLIIAVVTWRLYSRVDARYHGDPQCADAYDQWFGKKQTLDIRMIFGYKDARPARFVGDRYEKALFVAEILTPCEEESSHEACGFLRAPNNGTLFTKIISRRDGRPLEVRLKVIESSAGPDDEENRRDSHQTWLSIKAQEEFLQGIQHADVVFYNGHSRDGGGPDFRPAYLTADGHVDYSWYRLGRLGARSLLSSLRQSHSLKALGLFSCASTGHFSREVRSARKGLALFTEPRLVYQSEAMNSSLKALSDLLGQQCVDGFKSGS